jgi:DNA-binding winged helix-turn-helix (wHTH) protein/tetratricopeptide (TPR) repeat protein
MKRVSSGSEERERVVYEFDGFRVDPVRRVLSRHGEPVAMTPKALSILLVLLERAGEVVEKKELIERVWPGMFVSDANLTQNVFSLRKTLAERVPGGRYIVTVPGQGYSFVGEVRRVERQSTSEIPIVVDLPPPPPVEKAAAELPVAGAPTVPVALPVPSPRRRLPFQVLAALLILAAFGSALFSLFHSARQTRIPGIGVVGGAVRPAVAVLDFKNLSATDDRRWLDTAFAEMLTTDLAEGGALRVISGEAVAQAWRSLALPDPRNMRPADLKRLHDALGADLVIVGSYLPMGGKIRLDLRVLRAPGGETVTSFKAIGTEPELFELVSRADNELRKHLEIAELSPQQLRELRALHLSNPEARQLYAEGLRRLRAFDPPGALDFLQQADAKEPGSAVIHSYLSQAWSVLGYDVRALAEARRAQELAKSLSREQRLDIEGRAYKAAKNWEKASQTYQSLWTFFPDNVDYGLQLAESLMAASHGAEAAETLAALRKLPPPVGEDPRIDLVEARNAWRIGDFATEKRAAESAAAKGRRSGQSLVVAQALVFQGQAVLQMGRTQEAIGLYRQSAALCEDNGYQWGVGRALANIGTTLQAVGDLDGAQKANEQSLAIAQQLGSAIGMASQLYNLGELHRNRGELAEALPLLEQAWQWCVKMGDQLLEARALNAVGAALRDRGNLAGAQQRFERALDLSQAVGNPADEASSLGNLGSVSALRGELGEARNRFGETFSNLLRSGDSSQAASALAAWSDAVARLGNVKAAWQRSAQAQAAKQRAGDRLGTGHVLGLRAWLAFEMGDLAASRAMAEEQLRIAKETGAKDLAAWGLQNLGRVDFAAGDLAAARKSFEDALQSASARGEELRAMEVRLDLAGLALADGRDSEAARLARETAVWYRSHGIPGGETEALSLLAEVLLRQGLKAEAHKAAADASAKLERCEDHVVSVTAGVRLARTEAALGHSEDALERLRHAVGEAERSGLVAAGLEARLALGELQRSLRDPGAEATLAAVRKEARDRGFKRLAAST